MFKRAPKKCSTTIIRIGGPFLTNRLGRCTFRRSDLPKKSFLMLKMTHLTFLSALSLPGIHLFCECDCFCRNDNERLLQP
eukprot:4297590-Amphidinium_carterae.1